MIRGELVDRIAVRPAEPEDAEFLRGVFASTRELERRAARWTAEEWQGFIRLQYKAQETSYTTRFPSAERDIIQCGGIDIGEIWVHRSTDEIRLLDIAILPKYRSRGIGSFLIKQLQQDAESRNVPLRHFVEIENPDARRLYERLGFRAVETHGLHTLMEWRVAQSR